MPVVFDLIIIYDENHEQLSKFVIFDQPKEAGPNQLSYIPSNSRLELKIGLKFF